MKIFMIYNPVAGMQRTHELQTITNSLETRNVDYECFITSADVGPVDLLVNFDNSFDAILVAGGDGTLSDSIQAMHILNIDVPIQILPIGTTNDLASNLISSLDFDYTVKNLFNGAIIETDIGLSNENRVVSYALSFGNFTEVTYKTPQKLKNIFGYNAYLIFGLLTFRKIKSYMITVLSEELSVSDIFVLGIVSNTKQIGNIITYESSTVEFDDGYFEVLLVKKPKSLKGLRTIMSSIKSRNFDNDQFYFFKTKEIKLVSKKEVLWNHDGEFGGKSKEKELRILNKRIKFFQ